MICCLFFCNKIPRGILSRVHASWSFLINKYRLSSDESTGLPWLLCPVVCLLPGISRSLMWCLCWSPCTTSVPMCLSVDSRWCSLPWNLHNTAEHAQFSQLVLKPQAGLKTAKMIAEKKKSCYFPALYSVFTIHLSQRSSSIWQYQTQTHSHKCLPLQQPRQHHLPQLPSSVVVPLVVETSSE